MHHWAAATCPALRVSVAADLPAQSLRFTGPASLDRNVSRTYMSALFALGPVCRKLSPIRLWSPVITCSSPDALRRPRGSSQVRPLQAGSNARFAKLVQPARESAADLLQIAQTVKGGSIHDCNSLFRGDGVCQWSDQLCALPTEGLPQDQSPCTLTSEPRRDRQTRRRFAASGQLKKRAGRKSESSALSRPPRISSPTTAPRNGDIVTPLWVMAI